MVGVGWKDSDKLFQEALHREQDQKAAAQKAPPSREELEEAAGILKEKLQGLVREDSAGEVKFVYESVAGFYEMSFGSMEQALAHYKKCLERILWRWGKRDEYFTTLENICIVLQRLQRYEEAVPAYGETIEYARESNNRNMLQRCSNNLGAMYLDMGKPGEALPHLSVALPAYPEPLFDCGHECLDTVRFGGKLEVCFQSFRAGLYQLLFQCIRNFAVVLQKLEDSLDLGISGCLLSCLLCCICPLKSDKLFKAHIVLLYFRRSLHPADIVMELLCGFIPGIVCGRYCNMVLIGSLPPFVPLVKK